MRVCTILHTLMLYSDIEYDAMLRHLSKCHAGSIVLGQDQEVPNRFDVVTATHVKTDEKFGIGICSSNVSIPPACLPLAKENLLLIGYNSKVAAVELRTNRLRFDVELPFLFYFMFFYDAGETVVIVHEIGVDVVTLTGDIVWQQSTDIVSHYYIEGEKIVVGQAEGGELVYFLDDGRPA